VGRTRWACCTPRKAMSRQVEVYVDGKCVDLGLNGSTSINADAPPCCAGGYLQPADLPRHVGFCIAWMLILAWIFLGVALGADVFMSSIEQITSKEMTRTVTTASGKKKTFHVRVWNETVANLTLMALGSSAPEILINVLEAFLGKFYAGSLGPSTIVGSAAFNLMVITAVCVVALPQGETRTIKVISVFYITAAFSVIAYLWLIVIVVLWTPDVVTIEEGVITIAMLGVLIAMAYRADKVAAASRAKLRLGAGPGFDTADWEIATTL